MRDAAEVAPRWLDNTFRTASPMILASTLAVTLAATRLATQSST